MPTQSLIELEAVLCDLFGTILLFDTSPLPTVDLGGRSIKSTAPLLLPLLESNLAGVDPGQLQLALLATWQKARGDKQHREVSSSLRFAWALSELGVAEERCGPVGSRLADAHADIICGLTYLPRSHRRSLTALSARVPLALVSNFDHGAACRKMLARHGLESFFEAIYISDEMGIRKPNPVIFRTALDALGVGAAHTLFVGDSYKDDVAGAALCGMQTAWINPKAKSPPDGGVAPDWSIESFDDLPGVVGC